MSPPGGQKGVAHVFIRQHEATPIQEPQNMSPACFPEASHHVVPCSGIGDRKESKTDRGPPKGLTSGEGCKQYMTSEDHFRL